MSRSLRVGILLLGMSVSGDLKPDRAIQLVGPVMLNLVGAIPTVQQLLDQPVIIGGLAVMSRLGNAHRVTQDLDALRSSESSTD